MKLPTTKSTQEILKKTYQYLENTMLIIFICQQWNKYIRLATMKKLKLVPLVKNYAENLDLAIQTDFLSALDHEASQLAASSKNPDHREAVRAFIEKRTPKFSQKI